MPRPARACPPGVILHVLTRGNARATVFHSPGEFDDFFDLLRDDRRRAQVAVLGWCLMPNHFHIVLRPSAEGAVSVYMQWLLTTHAHRYRALRRDSGHVWQGRFKSFPVESDRQFVTLLRYVERNPVRAGLVERAETWPWSSLSQRVRNVADDRLLTASPVDLPNPWNDFVNEPLTAEELARVRESVRRGRPLGNVAWEEDIVARWGLESTTRPPGRPVRKTVPDPFRMPR